MVGREASGLRPFLPLQSLTSGASFQWICYLNPKEELLPREAGEVPPRGGLHSLFFLFPTYWVSGPEGAETS